MMKNKIYIPLILWLISVAAFCGMMLLNANRSSFIIEFELLSIMSIPVNYSIIIDSTSLSFSSLVCLISGCVMWFSLSYMKDDPFMDRFHGILLIFVSSMNLLIFSGSVLALLIGWDGLGVSSFLLIIYYSSNESLKSGFITLMTNRIGDALLIASGYLFVSSGQFTIVNLTLTTGFLMMISLAAMTKSAQYPFSSWLPAAMAAPTPVSALVHSSTLVTAGIFMMIRITPSSVSNNSILLLVGALTSLIGGWAASMENDLKKIIAYSTLSQLGVMMYSIGLGFTTLALFHLFTHALFKAMLFLAAGSILMAGNGVQDIRLLGSVSQTLPFLSIIFNISALSLVGGPFMSSFFSKHLLLELMWEQNTNFLSFVLFLISTYFTSKYVIRMMKSLVWGKNHLPVVSSISMLGSYMPLLILGVSAIIVGKYFSSWDVTLMLTPSFLSFGSLNMIVVLGFISGIFSKSISSANPYFFSNTFFDDLPVKSLLKNILNVEYGWIEPKTLGIDQMKFISTSSPLSFPKAKTIILILYLVFFSVVYF